MKLHFDPHGYRSREDLPAEFPPELRRVDASLAELAARERVPAGLEDRVYGASVTALPGRLRFRGRTAASGPRPVRFHRAVWGQLAMAASVGLTFVVVAWFLAMPANLHEINGLIAEHPGTADAIGVGEPTITTVAHRSAALSPDAEWLLFEQTFNGGRVGHIVDTRATTLADINRDFARVFDEFDS